MIKPLADLRLASSVVEFSWRRQRQATFNLTYAPMFGDLMARYPDSARPFLNDLLGTPAPDLSQPEAEAVCRILIDMPDTETWKNSARDLPPGKLQFDYDTKTWDARLLPGEGRTQRLILINKSRGPQKHCVVHWSIVF